MVLLTFFLSFQTTSLAFLFTSCLPHLMNTALNLISLYFFSVLLGFLYKIVIQNISCTHFTLFQFSISLCFIPFISFHLSLGKFYCEYIIIQPGFLNSHILSTDGSNCETLAERTDHLCPYHKLLSSLPLTLKANRWNCSYVYRQLTPSTLTYSHTGQFHMQ